MMNDKEVDNSLKQLAEKTDVFIAVTPENPRAMKAKALSEIAAKYCEKVLVCEKAVSAIDVVKDAITENDAFFMVGSLYLAGEVRTELIKKFK
ncbi:MAG: hypothetical protein IKL53_06525, partial [Lachnospiraceae bacterium]|nr:hypothetical protein [Lachnospiraceae bacterium]